jgi:hypothetical protein
MSSLLGNDCVNIVAATNTDNNREYFVITRCSFSMCSVSRIYKKFKNNRESVEGGRRWEAVDQGHEAVMERSSTHVSSDSGIVREAVKRRLFVW